MGLTAVLCYGTNIELAMSALKARPASFSASWDDVKKHAGSLAFSYISVTVLSAIAAIVFFIVNLLFTTVGGGPYSDLGPVLGLLAGSLGSIPFWIVLSLLSVLFVAIPAVYFERGDVITFRDALTILRANSIRYIMAGVFFTAAMSLGFAFCIIPGIAVALVTPIYVNKVFNSQLSIIEAFSSSFSAVYKGKGWSFVGQQVLIAIAVQFVSLCTCGVGLIIALPLAFFYLQNLAYNKGLVA